MTVELRESKKHLNADALSRVQQCEQCLIRHSDPKKKRNVKVYSNNDEDGKSNIYSEKIMNQITNRDIWNQEEDDTRKMVIKLLREENPSNETINKAGSEVKRYWRNKAQLRIQGDWLYLTEKDNYRVIVPKKKQLEVIWRTHRLLGHVGIERTSEAIKYEYYCRQWIRI